MKNFLFGIAAASTFAVPALGADMPVSVPVRAAPVPIVFSWTGFYVGADLGAAQGLAEWTQTDTVIERFKQIDDGFVYGGHAGFLYQGAAGWIVGLDAAYTRLNFTETSVALLSTNRSNSLEVDHLVTVVGRVGVSWDRSMVYFSGGWAMIETDFRRFVTSSNVTTASSSGWEHGWTVGFGGAYALMHNVVIGMDYNFVRIDMDDRNGTVATGFTGTDRVTNANAEIHKLTVRASLKFP